MPGLQGADVLARTREIYPIARRVLLTAYSDINAAVKAINEVADKIPGSPDVSGVDDTDGDGLDDDGKVLVTVGDNSACLTIEENGTGSDISDGAC